MSDQKQGLYEYSSYILTDLLFKSKIWMTFKQTGAFSMKHEVGISTWQLERKYGEKKTFELVKQIGADAVDFDLLLYDCSDPDSIYAKSDSEIECFFEELAEYAASLGIRVNQTHGQIRGFTGKPEQDALLLKNARLDCLATKALGAEYCVMHTVSTYYTGKDAPEETMFRLNREMFLKIIPFAKQYGITICTETFGNVEPLGTDCIDFFGDLSHFITGYRDVLQSLSDPGAFKICMDTGHSNKSSPFPGNPGVGDVIRALGNDIKVLHLHDNDAYHDQHKIPLTGTIDWKDVFDALDEIGYCGVYNMEVSLEHFGKDFEIEEAAFAVKILRHFLCERYANEPLS